MAGYVFIASRDPWEGTEGLRVFELAGSLAETRDAVTVYLTENGAFAARADAGERVLSPLIKAGVTSWSTHLHYKNVASPTTAWSPA
jgi:hypothetical protein